MEWIDELWNTYSTNVWWRDAGIVFAGFIVHLFIRLFLLRGMERMAAATSNDLDDRLVLFFKRFYLLVLAFLLFLLVLKNHGVEITPFLASAGIAGIAIGLAAKETLADIFAGVFLIADRPIRIGDRIKIDRIGRHWGGWGDVLEIGLRRTQIRNTDGVIVDYPNNLLANSVITNFSILDKPVRVRIRFQVNYDADIEKVIEVTKLAINEVPDVMADSADIMVRELWSDNGGHLLSGVLIEGRYLLQDVKVRTRVRSLVLRNVLKHFRNEGIHFASPEFKMQR